MLLLSLCGKGKVTWEVTAGCLFGAPAGAEAWVASPISSRSMRLPMNSASIGVSLAIISKIVKQPEIVGPPTIAGISPGPSCA